MCKLLKSSNCLLLFRYPSCVLDVKWSLVRSVNGEFVKLIKECWITFLLSVSYWAFKKYPYLPMARDNQFSSWFKNNERIELLHFEQFIYELFMRAKETKSAQVVFTTAMVIHCRKLFLSSRLRIWVLGACFELFEWLWFLKRREVVKRGFFVLFCFLKITLGSANLN